MKTAADCQLQVAAKLQTEREQRVHVPLAVWGVSGEHLALLGTDGEALLVAIWF